MAVQVEHLTHQVEQVAQAVQAHPQVLPRAQMELQVLQVAWRHIPVQAAQEAMVELAPGLPLLQALPE